MRYLILILALAFSTVGFAQQPTNYTNYTFNKFELNPAFAGIKNCSEFRFGNRRQWVGFEGAPVVNYASFYGRLFGKEKRFVSNYQGGGIFFSSENIGISTVGVLKFAYSYHLKVNRNDHLAMGLFAGIHQYSINSSVFVSSQVSNDPALASESRTYVYPEITPGFYYYNEHFYAGLSAFYAFPAKWRDLGAESNLSPHFFLTGGYRIDGKTFSSYPSLLFSFTPVISPTLDLSYIMDYKNKVAFGLGTKYLNSAYAVFRVRAFRLLNIGYAYEYALNRIAKVAPSTHEITIGFSGCGVSQHRENPIYCPAYD